MSWSLFKFDWGSVCTIHKYLNKEFLALLPFLPASVRYLKLKRYPYYRTGHELC